MDPVTVVERQLAAYNARDLEGFVCCFADPVVWTTGLDGARPRTRAQLREDFGRLFDASPELHAEIADRMVLGPWVVDRELVKGLYGEDMSALVVYRVQKGLVVDVTLLPETG